MSALGLRQLIAAENIDRKLLAGFTRDTKYHAQGEIYFSPEVVIIKNKEGRRVFNAWMSSGDFREKGVRQIGDDITYPYYVLSMDWIAAGCRFGIWEHYQSREQLGRQVLLDDMVDDFERLADDLHAALGS
ncbi:MAG TPA: hypothetical protein VK997_12985 [Deferrisomatales bacterium]|nr:hypothetical protein [Deferrisomatales bacterium]